MSDYNCTDCGKVLGVGEAHQCNPDEAMRHRYLGLSQTWTKCADPIGQGDAEVARVRESDRPTAQSFRAAFRYLLEHYMNRGAVRPEAEFGYREAMDRLLERAKQLEKGDANGPS